MSARWLEFFQVCGEFSMRNLTIFLTVVNAIWLLDYMGISGGLSDEVFVQCYCALLLAGAGVYGFGKWQDGKSARTPATGKLPKVK